MSVAVLSMLSGCSKVNNNETVADVEILANKVVVNSDLVLSNTPERYQPSYNLNGELIPIQQKVVTFPFDAYDLEYIVETGDWVTVGEPILRLKSDVDVSQLKEVDYDFIDTLSHGFDTLTNALPENALSSDTTIAYDAANQSPSITANTEVAPHQVRTLSSEPSNKSASQLASQSIPTSTDKTDSNNNPVHARKQPSASAQINANGMNEVNDKEDTNLVTADNLSIPSSSSKKQSVTFILKSPIEGEITDVFTKTISKKATNATNDAPKQTTNKSLESNRNESDNTQSMQTVQAGTPLVTVANTRALQLQGKLPLSTQSQLSVGQAVKFKVYETQTEFAGQISAIDPQPEKDYLVVHAPIIANPESKALLYPGMRTLMTIDYGQIELGVKVPRLAIHDAYLSELNATHTHPVSPIHGYTWVIGQDQRLAYTPIEIVRYYPDSDQFLVHGINNDSLICMADLPKKVDGMTISLK